MIEAKSKFRRLKPLVQAGDDLFVSRGNRVFRQNGSELTKLFEFPRGFIRGVLERSPLFFRLVRGDVYSASLFDGCLYLSYRKKMYRFSSDEALSVEFEFIKGNGPLSFSVIEGVAGFTDCVAFGEYFGNKDKGNISVFRRLKGETPTWEVVHTFERGQINHIHALVPDQERCCVWILAGDFGGAAGIWKATNDFSSIEPVVSGHQVYRACVAFPINSGLLYATDSQLERNSVRLLSFVGGRWLSQKLFDINGPSIYGVELKDYYVFSTSTEPNVIGVGKFKSYITNTPGPGILENKMDVVVCRKSDLRHMVLYSCKKDVFPYKLFQFGSVMFPKVTVSSNTLFTYSVASKKNDLTLCSFNLDDMVWDY